MRIRIEFDTDTASFSDIKAGVTFVISQALRKVWRQLGREPCQCCHPEEDDILRDLNGNVIGRVEVNESSPDDRTPTDFKTAVEKLRCDMLCSSAGENLGPVAEQQYLLALAALETAQRHLALAAHHDLPFEERMKNLFPHIRGEEQKK